MEKAVIARIRQNVIGFVIFMRADAVEYIDEDTDLDYKIISTVDKEGKEKLSFKRPGDTVELNAKVYQNFKQSAPKKSSKSQAHFQKELKK